MLRTEQCAIDTSAAYRAAFISKTEQDLVTLCREIGGIADSNSQYTAALAQMIHVTGAKIEDLTVKELLAVSRMARDLMNRRG